MQPDDGGDAAQSANQANPPEPVPMEADAQGQAADEPPAGDTAEQRLGKWADTPAGHIYELKLFYEYGMPS